MQSSTAAFAVKPRPRVMRKRCRFCRAVIEAGERYCGPQCRLNAVGRQDLVVKQDAERGWNTVAKEIRQPWRRD